MTERDRRRPLVDPSLILDALITNSEIAFYARDSDGRYVATSRTYCELLGLSPERTVGHMASDFLPREIADRVNEINQRVIESNRPLFTEESHVIRGEPRHFLVHRVPIHAPDGRVVGVFGIAHDQTQRIRLLRETETMNRVLALFASASHLQAYASGLVDILAEVTKCRMVGIRAIESAWLGWEQRRGFEIGAAPFVAQRGFPDSLIEGTREPGFLGSECPCAAVLRRDASALVPANLDEHGCLFVLDTGSLRPSLGSGTSLKHWASAGIGTLAILPLRHANEALGCIVVADPEPNHLSPSTVDLLHKILPLIAEAFHRFDVERRLEASRTRLQSVVHSIPLPVWIVDSRFRVVFRNDCHVRTFGPSEEGALCYMVLHGINEPCPGCDFPETLMRMTTRREWRDTRTDRTFDVIAVPYDSISGERHRLEVFFEVTERVRMEAQLRQTQRLDSLGSLAAGIAHDFNNILAGVIGYSQLGLQRSKESEVAQTFRQIGEIAERGAELTRKILAFSRRQPLKVAPLDINALILGMRTMLHPLVRERIELVFDLQEGLWTVQGDESQIEQVLLNLCVNAVEAMPGGGTLTIRTRNIEGENLRRAFATSSYPSSNPSSNTQNHIEPSHGIAIEVSDTGHGMTPDVLSQAIEPFFTTKGRGRGTGLGLSVSFGIIQQHRGNMVIESGVGSGTTVRVYLPSLSVTPSKAVRTLRTEVIPRHPGLSQCSPMLIVEDDPAIRGLVKKLLSEIGIESLTADDGASALAILASREIQIRFVITDVAMPGMSGVELARHCRRIAPHTPILFMSGCSETTLEQYGMSEYDILLRKPFTLQELVDAIEQTLVKKI